MYHHLRGELAVRTPLRLVVETGGVGYEVTVPLSTGDRVGPVGSEVKLLTHLVVREDLLQLVGFLTEDERSLFRTLIGLSGVGPALALQILSSASPQDFAVAVERQDTGFFKKIKGVGEKTAKRIILELKGAKTLLPGGADSPALPAGIAADAVAALETMGIPQKEAVARVEAVLADNPDLSLEEIVRQALR